MALTPDLLISALDAIRSKGIVAGLTFDKDDETTQSFVDGVATFQRWANANAVGNSATLRTDGVLDMDSVKILLRASEYSPVEWQSLRESMKS